VRRIEALTGTGAVAHYQRERASLEQILGVLNTSADQGVDTVQKLQAEARRLAREVEQLKLKAALGGSSCGSDDETSEVNGVKVLARHVSGLEKGALRGLSDSLRDRLGTGVVIVASDVGDGKVALVVSVTKDLTSRLQAGRIVKELAPIIGGGGGGRPDFAEAGGKDASKIGELLRAAPDAVARLLV
jgi:alanyl-tRNA synthetase